MAFCFVFQVREIVASLVSGVFVLAVLSTALVSCCELRVSCTQDMQIQYPFGGRLKIITLPVRDTLHEAFVAVISCPELLMEYQLSKEFLDHQLVLSA